MVSHAGEVQIGPRSEQISAGAFLSEDALKMLITPVLAGVAAKLRPTTARRASVFGTDYPATWKSWIDEGSEDRLIQAGFDGHSSTPTPADRRRAAGILLLCNTRRVLQPAMFWTPEKLGPSIAQSPLPSL